MVFKTAKSSRTSSVARRTQKCRCSLVDGHHEQLVWPTSVPRGLFADRAQDVGRTTLGRVAHDA